MKITGLDTKYQRKTARESVNDKAVDILFKLKVKNGAVCGCQMLVDHVDSDELWEMTSYMH